jgi:serine/threonine protein kinase
MATTPKRNSSHPKHSAPRPTVLDVQQRFPTTLPGPPNLRAGEDNKFPLRFGPYVLAQFLGEGGMGRVYLALMGTQGTEKLCVVKRMSTAWSNIPAVEIPRMERRFWREAKIAMSLSHGSIAQTFHAGEEQGPYLVQEFVHGKDLRSLVSAAASTGEAIPVAISSYIVSQIARGLAYLHDFQGRGLVHRDVTPENVLLSFTGEVKLIDFGVAKATSVEDSLTQRGGWLGKPNWTAPELAYGGRLDRRADLFSLGLLYWYLLSGKDPGAILANSSEPNERFPPPSTFNPEVSPELDRIVTKAINVDPEFRFQRAEDFQQVVSHFIPTAFLGERQVATMLSRYSYVRKDELLASLVSQARPLLDQVLTPSQPREKQEKQEKRVPSRRDLRKWGLPAFLALGAATLATILAYSPWRTPAPAAAPAPSQPAPRLAPHDPSLAGKVPPDARIAAQASERSLPDLQPRPAAQVDPSQADPAQAEPAQADPRQNPARALPRRSSGELLDDAETQAMDGKPEKALRLARLAARVGGGARAHIMAGHLLLKSEHLKDAQAEFLKALSKDPENTEARTGLARTRERIANQ